MPRISVVLLTGIMFAFGVAVMTFAHFGNPSLLSSSEKSKIAAVKQYQAEHNGRLPSPTTRPTVALR